MQVNPTVTEAARRVQITDAAIEVIADLGYGKASFARIVERAGLSSTRMISYHFAGKSELMMAVLISAIGEADRLLTERVDGITDRAGMLSGYIEARMRFLRDRPAHMRALVEIGANARDEDGAPLYRAVLQDFRVGRVQRQLAQGQREGAFGDFDPAVMAHSINGALDAAVTAPGVDLDEYGRELAGLFARATAPVRT